MPSQGGGAAIHRHGLCGAGRWALNLFISCGLEEKTAQNAVANVKVTANLTAVIHEVCIGQTVEIDEGILFGCCLNQYRV